MVCIVFAIVDEISADHKSQRQIKLSVSAMTVLLARSVLEKSSLKIESHALNPMPSTSWWNLPGKRQRHRRRAALWCRYLVWRAGVGGLAFNIIVELIRWKKDLPGNSDF